MRETDLYPPLKAYLEGQGYEVKSEVGACDILARRGDEPPVVVEMKTSFSLALVLQGVQRQSLFADVYLAVPVSGAKGWRLRYRDILLLCRRLGLGLLAVDPATGTVTAHLDPAAYQPRLRAERAGRLLREFDRRVGDPNQGGAGAVKRMTAYRQDALRCAAQLEAEGAAGPAALARATGVTRAAAILRDDHYGWFERIARGTYALTPKGRAALAEHAPALPDLGLALPQASAEAAPDGA